MAQFYSPSRPEPLDFLPGAEDDEPFVPPVRVTRRNEPHPAGAWVVGLIGTSIFLYVAYRIVLGLANSPW